jgi:mono/diheme cytochrome c family protein
MKRQSPHLLLACLMTSLVSGHTAVAEPATGITAPFDLSDPARIATGKKRFGANCAAYCHGSEGEGGKTPAFKGNTNFSPADAHKTITEGRTGSDVMPPWGNAFTPEQIWELVAYLNHLSKQPASH